jgi:hypothetical protein
LVDARDALNQTAEFATDTTGDSRTRGAQQWNVAQKEDFIANALLLDDANAAAVDSSL